MKDFETGTFKLLPDTISQCFLLTVSKCDMYSQSGNTRGRVSETVRDLLYNISTSN